MTARKSPLFDLRAGAVEALQLSPRSADPGALREALEQHLAGSPDFFRGEALVIDLSRLPEGHALDVDALADWLAERGLRPLGLLAGAGEAPATRLPLLHGRARPAAEAAPQPSGAAAPAAEAAKAAAAPAAGASTVLVDRPLRSGQRVYSAGDVIVLEAVSHGAEIIAGGNIHVYAALRGRALAGAHGDASARIFCSCLEPELVAIAGVYRTAEQPLPAEVAGKSAQVLLEGDTLRFEPLRGR
ncbi:MAG: septum site-determining protein MinC [Betaproteobacteria bacterium]|nr:septum site-determining protein MinC [Betaproteobacteria bacterium]MDE1954926.1 septum site-determining protein MinC [Betaproteobacteria bacterium]MDE2152615.1 septum site-determining protein MinC [Betaproteobacteria bacterium]